ncbi:MAG TPA: hypothetical protein VF974_01090 [Patescibacteria group bacterium]
MSKKIEIGLGVVLVVFITVLAVVIGKNLSPDYQSYATVSPTITRVVKTAKPQGLGSQIYVQGQNPVSDKLPATNPLAKTKINPFE